MDISTNDIDAKRHASSSPAIAIGPKNDHPLAVEFASQSFATYGGDKVLPEGRPRAELPKVSFIMTAHNSEETIERAVQSLLAQSWPNLEIVICDDNSTDSTWDILRELKRASPSVVRIVRMESNLGTYIAKNVAIRYSTGEYILFQDSDDYSHPDRATVQVIPLINNDTIAATRTKYCRFDPDSGRIVPIGEHISKFGLITLAVRRSLFADIGYFDAVKRAGDDEWYQRMLHFCGKEALKSLDATLYIAELRPKSLAADLISIKPDGTAQQTVSDDRAAYVSLFQKRFSSDKNTKSWFQKRFTTMPLRAGERYPGTIGALPNDSTPKFAAVCSIPSRQEGLRRVVNRLLLSVDRIYVYLDKYPEIPQFLKNSRISVYRSEDYDPDFRDNAKFLPYNYLKNRYGSFYYFTCDDDLDYPFDYVQTLQGRLDKYDRSIIAGVHGVVCEESPSEYFRRRFLYHFVSATLTRAKLVNNLGTGTVAFHSDLFDRIEPCSWPRGGMVDIFFSIEAKRRGIPMVSIDRRVGWLKELNLGADNPTLYQEFSGVSDKEFFMAETLRENGPWGYKSILSTLEKQTPKVRRLLDELLPHFAQDISVADTLGRQRG